MTPASIPNLREARRERGLSQTELARRAGVPQQYVSMIELAQEGRGVLPAIMQALELGAPAALAT